MFDINRHNLRADVQPVTVRPTTPCSSYEQMVSLRKLVVSVLLAFSTFTSILWTRRIFSQLLSNPLSPQSLTERQKRQSFAFEYLKDAVETLSTPLCEDWNVALTDELSLSPSAENYRFLRLYDTCIQLFARPNFHRLAKLAEQAALMWVDQIWCGEFTLERTHQRTKRALLLTNNKKEQSFIMSSLLFSDWQARLASCYSIQNRTVHLNINYAARFLTGGAEQPEPHTNQ